MMSRVSISLSEQAYLKIRDKIVRLEMAPGDVIREDVLQAELGIGRTPIREALQRLARDQFVTVIPRRGMLVSGIDVMELSMLYETRASKSIGMQWLPTCRMLVGKA
jgi:DNA-binding GntR family transcriptional regulator